VADLIQRPTYEDAQGRHRGQGGDDESLKMLWPEKIRKSSGAQTEADIKSMARGHAKELMSLPKRDT